MMTKSARPILNLLLLLLLLLESSVPLVAAQQVDLGTPTSALPTATVTAPASIGTASSATATNLLVNSTSTPSNVTSIYESTPASTETTEPLPPGGERYRNTVYVFVGEEKTWEDARAACHDMSGVLVRVADSDAQNYLQDKLNSYSAWTSKGVWIGANDIATSNTWQWANQCNNSGPLIAYSSWYNNAPNQLTGYSCVHIRREDNWKWRNVLCTYTYRFICQLEDHLNYTCPISAWCSDGGKGTCFYIGLGVGLLCIFVIFVTTIAVVIKKRGCQRCKRSRLNWKPQNSYVSQRTLTHENPYDRKPAKLAHECSYSGDDERPSTCADLADYELPSCYGQHVTSGSECYLGFTPNCAESIYDEIPG